MRLAINIYRSKRWEMTKKEACWDGLGSWKAPEIRGSGLLERPTSTANAGGIQNRSSGGEPVNCRRAMEDWRQFPRSLNSSHTSWTDLGYSELANRQARRKDEKNQARELVTYLEKLWKNQSCQARVWQVSQRKEDSDRGGASGKMGACSLCPAEQQGLWHWHIPLLPPTEEMFVVTNLHLIIHVPGDFISPVHEQFMRIPFNWILTRMEHAALEISSC